MTAEKHINFINNRIEKLQTAIFYNFSKSLIRFPTCLIKITGADGSGNIWFAVKKPYADITDFDKEFPAQLQFYNKRYAFYITVHGRAIIIPENDRCSDEALIRFRIFNVEYYYSKRKAKTGFNHLVADFITSLFTVEREHHSLQLF
jgi:hypothetical protein